MRLRDLGEGANRDWFNQLLDWSRKRITFDDNVDCQILTVNIGLAETEIGHTLGRIPRYVIEVAAFPNGTAGINFTKASDNTRLFLKRNTAGMCTLFIL